MPAEAGHIHLSPELLPGLPPTLLGFTKCRSLQEYYLRCIEPEDGEALPVLSPSAAGTARRLGAERRSSETWNELSWSDHATLIARARPQVASTGGALGRPPAVVLGFAGPQAFVAGLVAGRLRAEVTIVEPAPAGIRRIRETIAEVRHPVVVVAVSQDMTDALVVGLLADLDGALRSRLPWHAVPHWTLLTARDLPSLTWVAAKACSPTGPQSSRTFAHLLPGTERCTSRRLETDGGASANITTTVARGDEVPALLLGHSDVVAIQTHGSDACARGGDGTVLCGLHQAGAGSRRELPGALACGHGWACPRGRTPVPLSRIGAEVLMVASCNGLRLADSNTQPAFNLGLSFLDGAGRAYVASASSAIVTDAMPVAFLAALASERDLAESVAIVNAFMTCAGLEQPTYAAVGLPGHRISGVVAGGSQERESLVADLTPDQGELYIDGSGRLLVEAVIRDPDAIQLVRSGDLALAAHDLPLIGPSARELSPRFWFARIEPDARASADASDSDVARLFLFSFPYALGDVHVQLRDASSFPRQLTSALDALGRWKDLWRLTVMNADIQPSVELEILGEIEAAETEARHTALRRLTAVRFDIDACRDLDRLIAAIESLGRFLRELLMEHLVPQLASSFYLTNQLVPEHLYTGGEAEACRYCGGSSIRKRLVHVLSGQARHVHVCARCGIVSDTPALTSLDVSIDAPDLLERGEVVTVRVVVPPPLLDEVVVGCRLSTHGHADEPPDPVTCMLPPEGDGIAVFRVPVPLTLPPHEYSFKALVANRDGIAFAHRLAWVQ